MVLAKRSHESLNELNAEAQQWLEKDPECKKTKKSSNEFNNCLRMYLAKENPAYTQMFGADPENLDMSLEATHKLSLSRLLGYY